MEQIYNLSDLTKVLVFVLLSCSSAALVYHALNATIGKFNLPSDSYYGVNIIGTMTSLCSILLVFVLIQAISTNAKINSIVSDQLSEMYKFEKHLMVMPKSYVNEIKPHFAAYIDSIISDEWKLMGSKAKSNETEKRFDEFLASVANVEDADSGLKLAKGDFATLTDGLSKVRYLKLRAKASSLPSELYLGIVFLLLHVAAQGLVFGLIFVYDHPFYGERGVKAEAYVDVREKLNAIEGR